MNRCCARCRNPYGFCGSTHCHCHQKETQKAKP